MHIVDRPALPRAPRSFGEPVPAPPVRAGDDARAANVRARGALAAANTRLADDRAFYAAVCAAFSSHPCGPQ